MRMESARSSRRRFRSPRSEILRIVSANSSLASADSSSFLEPSRRSFKSLRARMDTATMASLREGAVSICSDSRFPVAGLCALDFREVSPDEALSAESWGGGGILTADEFPALPGSPPGEKSLSPIRAASRSPAAIPPAITGLEKREGRGMTGFVGKQLQSQQRGRGGGVALGRARHIRWARRGSVSFYCSRRLQLGSFMSSPPLRADSWARIPVHVIFADSTALG